MARTWTEEQKKVIELHNRNILVSAAAGSGKTAVLVERIIHMITDPDEDIDIDKLVVVTFTKAAAGEMRQRISAAIEEKLEENPDNEKLQKQLTLIHNAQITTIDSFCLNIIRNNFTNADIDPGFRTADEGELKLLEADIMEKILEEYYNSDRQDFFDFIDSYGTGKSDSAVEELIYQLYRYSRSYPWPMEWLNHCSSSYEITDEESLNNIAAVDFLTDYIKKIVEDYRLKYEKLLDICKEADGPSMYQPMIASDLEHIHTILSLDTFKDLGKFLSTLTFEKMSSKRGTDVDADKKEYVKYHRDLFKKVITDLQKKLFKQSMEENLEDILINKNSILILIELTKRFYLDMKAAKRDKNIIDFNDMEHLALDILVKYENGTFVYSDVANRLSEFYDEILIDEYQDSNLLQEQILYSISKGRLDPLHNNMFMVGDVKQSIYKFRLARPELFIEKYNTYTNNESSKQKIELRKNFRSRHNVLMTINDVFFNIMKHYFGGIEYDENVMLNTGLKFPEPDSNEEMERVGGNTEILIINTKVEEDEQSESNEDEEEYLAREIEAKAIAHRIKKLVDKNQGQLVYDSKTNSYRPAQYKDIVILTRTVSGWADTFVNVLMNEGIPAFSDTASGYFNTREIKLLLSYLSVIDNPIQDIPLAAVMTSYFGNFTTQELADMRKDHKKAKLYQSISDYTGEDDTLNGKIHHLLENLNYFRKLSIYTDISELIWKIIYDTGYYDYVGTMPAGAKRQANLDMLIEKAKSYEGTSYRGLFNFLRYIEKLRKYEVDYGEATILGENEDLVRIMSIHKSKGLEFPIVILAGMSKPFNNMDSRANVVIDADLGIGANSINLENRTKTSTIIKNAIGIKLKLENMYEELRVLYVALTRAKEKLIMTGTIKSIEKTYDIWATKATSMEEDHQAFSFADLERCSNYFDFVVPTALRRFGSTGNFFVDLINAEEVLKQCDNLPILEKNLDSSANNQSNTQEYIYPFETVTFMKGKMTVSELKKIQQEITETDTVAYESEFDEIQEEAEIKPRFITGELKLQGAERGTAYHRVMECFQYEYADSIEQVEECLNMLKDTNKITKQQLMAIDCNKIYGFCKSNIGMRVQAQYGKTLNREQQFIYGIEPVQGEFVLIQGVIDLYFEEDDSIIIVDYKTDHVPKGEIGRQLLIDRYKVQLDYYAAAITQLTGKPVSEKIIYSFELEEEIGI